ncbi:hypothetical protein EB796_017003 [Bugula neritina]|uniref:AAA+ ATPase domain-containing protein n=1 Tax=Bugula neritina TaxID=10212 RepID=A0A7J7JGE6_BUGNE|nr:hypothetical protein EB796_017003 [Bugula neritina]
MPKIYLAQQWAVILFHHLWLQSASRNPRILFSHTASNKSNNNQQAGGKESNSQNEEAENKGPEENWGTLIMVAIVTGILFNMLSGRKLEYITWQQFLNDYLKKGEVKALYSRKGVNLVEVHLHTGHTGTKQSSSSQIYRNVVFMEIDPEELERKIQEAEQKLGIAVSDSLQITWRSAINESYVRLAFLLILGIFMMYMWKSISKVNPFETLFKASYTRGDQAISSAPKIKFKDIAGMKEAKVEIKEYVEYLKNPSRFQNLGAKIPRGALLLGPPGCGKTLLAKAVAAESDVPFLVMAGSDFVEMIGGLGAGRVRSLFKDARNLKPCIIYIDEIDAIGRSRAASGSSLPSGADESEHTLNQLLVEMDGMTDNSGVILLASTNRAEVLDKALLRPGRLDRHIAIDLPTLAERKELFEMYLKKISMDKPITDHLDFLAQSTPGKSGADIANICNEAALNAARESSDTVKETHLMYALDRILVGQAKQTNTISKQEKRTIAYHECGHVLVGWLLEHTDALLKVSLIPRTSAALGFAQYLPSDKKLYSKEELFQRMCMLLGGRAAETIVFNRITTGAQDDLDKVRQLAYNQIKTYGMGESVGILSFPSNEGEEYQVKPYSKQLQQKMDMEAQQMIANAYKKAEQLILTNRNKLDELCKLLLTKEEMSYDEVKAVIGPPPHGEKKKVDMLNI